MAKANINIQTIQEEKINYLANSLINILGRFYEDPENKRKFEEWEAKKRLEEAS